MKKILTGYIAPVLALFFSVLLRIVSSTEFFDSFLCKVVVEDRVLAVKEIIDIVDYAVFVIPLGIQSVVHAKQAARCKDVVTNFGQVQREVIGHALREHGYIDGTSDDINIRVFKKRFGRLVLEDKMKFCAREIKGKLSFSIAKNEGLCVKAYKESKALLEIEDASKVDYNLNERQKALAGQLKFIVAVPIHPDTDSPVKRVICFDSFQKIAKNGCEDGILKICEGIAYHIHSVID